MNKLTDLIKGYRSDKGTRHSYIDEYERILSPIKQDVKNILEVGIFDGGSIQMWTRYFEKANVYGVDNAKYHEIPTFLKEYDRITTYKANAYNLDFIYDNFTCNNIKFDIVIDDGSHIKEDVIFFAHEYSKLLTTGGLLFIEDIQDYKWVNDIIDAFPDNVKKNTVMDFRRNKKRYDDILLMAESF